MYKKTSEAILSINLGLIGENFVTSFIKPEINRNIMEKVCEVVPKNLQNFGLKNIRY